MRRFPSNSSWYKVCVRVSTRSIFKKLRSMDSLRSSAFRCFVLLLTLQTTSAFESETPLGLDNDNYHFIQASSFQTASTCNPSAQDSSEGFLKVVHNHGPCSSHKQAASLAEVLERDQARFKAKYSEFSGMNLNHNHILGGYSKAVTIPTRNQDANTTLSSYNVDLFVGTPKKKITLIMDTGSDLFWTQCQPCTGGCYKQRNPIFNPSKSSTYINITCGTPTCKQIINTTGYAPGCISKTCRFEADYASPSPIKGFVAKERVSLTPIDIINDIVFGCSVDNKDATVGIVDGILGLGSDPLSIVQQTVKKYQRVFSYCLPSKTSETGFLKFGKSKPVSKSLKFTQLRGPVNFKTYVIDIVGIKLAGKKLPIIFKKNVASIDSGAVLSRIPKKEYETLRTAYRKAMSHYRLIKQGKGTPLDTCYYVSGHQKLKIPKMSFLFANGIAVDIHPQGIAYPISSTIYCLPFLPAEKVVFGATQQQSLEVVYDVAGGKIGFGYDGCK